MSDGPSLAIGPTYIVPVHGTWSGAWAQNPDKHWWWMGPWWRFMRGQGFAPARPRDPFRWSGDIDGATGWLHRMVGRPPDEPTDWLAGGDSFRWYCSSLIDVNAVVHSHGLNIPLIACSHPTDPLRLRVLVSIGSPVRDDMMVYAEAAKKNIGFWLHLYDARFDKMGSWGELGDGKWQWWWSPKSRAHPLADLNVPVPGIGHSGLLVDEKLFPLWYERGWLDMIFAGAAKGHPWRAINPAV